MQHLKNSSFINSTSRYPKLHPETYPIGRTENVELKRKPIWPSGNRLDRTTVDYSYSVRASTFWFSGSQYCGLVRLIETKVVSHSNAPSPRQQFFDIRATLDIHPTSDITKGGCGAHKMEGPEESTRSTQICFLFSTVTSLFLQSLVIDGPK